MKEVKMLTGLLLIDAPLSALNNARVERGVYVNKVPVKKVKVRGGIEYPYVSGQAFKRWWRETIHDKFAWTPSQIYREEKIAYTEANPIKCEEDDIFGYMLAPEKKLEEIGMVAGLAYRRVAPLKVTPLISLFPNVIGKPDFGVFTRGDESQAEPVPYEQELYSTVLKGAFSLMLSEIGVFSMGRAKDLPKPTDVNEALRGKTFDNKAKKQIDKQVEKFKQRVGDLQQQATKLKAEINEGASFIKLSSEERKKRASETIRALAELGGGAKCSGYLTDVAPKFVILTCISCANHIFMDVVKPRNGDIVLDSQILTEVAQDYYHKFLSPIFIGLRKGFLVDAEYDKISSMKSITVEGNKEIEVKFGTPRQALEEAAHFIEKMTL